MRPPCSTFIASTTATSSASCPAARSTSALDLPSTAIPPWPLLGVQRWNDQDLLRVNGTVLAIDHAIAGLDFIWGEAPVARRLVDVCLIKAELEREPIVLSDAELQQVANAFRAGHRSQLDSSRVYTRGRRASAEHRPQRGSDRRARRRTHCRAWHGWRTCRPGRPLRRAGWQRQQLHERWYRCAEQPIVIQRQVQNLVGVLVREARQQVVLELLTQEGNRLGTPAAMADRILDLGSFGM